MNEYEKKLFDNGFTTKDIGKLRSIVKKDESQSDTLKTLVIDLSKRFWGGVIGVSILILIGLYGALNADKSDFLSYVIVPGFAFLIIYFVTPLRLSWKAYRFIKKNDNS